QGSRSVWEYAYELTYKLDTIGLNDARERVYRLWHGFEPHIQEWLWRDRLDPEVDLWDDIIQSAEAAEHA
ncbi:hypothetical protein DFP72DRAFT_751957, partial [Ephemerocybe angulata]